MNAPVQTQAATAGYSQGLRQKVSLVLPALMAAGSGLMAHPRIAEIYPEYLFALHCVARSAVPLMSTALERARALEAGDPVAAELATYLVKHIPEEQGHDIWLLEDLEALGIARDRVLRRAPSPTAAALVGSQYYWAFHHHPVALLGFLEGVEGYPPAVEQVERLIAATGYPRDAFRALRRHARLDLRHREDLHELLDRLPLTPEHESLIGVSAFHTIHLASQAITEIMAQPATTWGR